MAGTNILEIEQRITRLISRVPPDVRTAMESVRVVVVNPDIKKTGIDGFIEYLEECERDYL